MTDQEQNSSVTLKQLNGETLLVPVLGDPVKQVRSPKKFTEGMQRAGMNAVHLPLQVTPENLAEFLTCTKSVSNIVGFVLTIPHKFASIDAVDSLTDTARAAGSINLMRREKDGTWLGHNLDGVGLVKGLIADGADPKGKAVFIAGAGGAGCGAAAAFAAAGASSLKIFDISSERADALVERIAANFPSVKASASTISDPSNVDIAVNASPMGMKPDDPLPFQVSDLRPGAVVAEFVMKPAITRLLEAARSAGHQIALGENVMGYQEPEVVAFLAAACDSC